jgi:hypothetical protein
MVHEIKVPRFAADNTGTGQGPVSTGGSKLPVGTVTVRYLYFLSNRYRTVP